MLWDGIRRGVIHTIGTDHSGFTREAKVDPTQNVGKRRQGFPNLQEYPPCYSRTALSKTALRSSNSWR
jgi:dihydroorotase-like cyclic amidohydrolase